MPKGKSDKPVFKPYDQHQLDLIPPTAKELIPEDHLVRVVNEVIDGMDLQPVMEQYTKGGGASRYHPLMLVKVLVYAYANGIFTSRKIAKQLRENIHFMWISGKQTPDFRTINSFRKDRLKPVIQQVFTTLVKVLHNHGHVKLENYFLDGTKIESKAGRYTFVWGRAVDKFEKRIDEKLLEYLNEAEKIADEENLEYGDLDLEEMGRKKITKDEIRQISDRLSEILKQLNQKAPEKKQKQESKKKVQKMIKTINQDFSTRKDKYRRYNEIKGPHRNSFSKTDPDATFMRMKEDHMRNGQLKPGYNVQVGTENGFVLGYSVHQRPTDTRTLIPHMEHIEKMLGKKPKRVIADSGYGSQENYEYLNREDVEALVKYNVFDKEITRSFKKQIYRVENWEYDEEKDHFVCPQGKFLEKLYETKYKTEAGFQTSRNIYGHDECPECPVLTECSRGKYRRVRSSPKLRRLKQKTQERLRSDWGAELRKRRAHEVETVFGELKGNQGFRRFYLGGLDGVSIEWGLHMMAYNLKKLWRKA